MELWWQHTSSYRKNMWGYERKIRLILLSERTRMFLSKYPLIRRSDIIYTIGSWAFFLSHVGLGHMILWSNDRPTDFSAQNFMFNPYPWISEKKSKTRDCDRECFAEKNSRAQHWTNLYLFLCCGFFFRKSRSVLVPKNGIFFIQRRIFPRILAYANWN